VRRCHLACKMVRWLAGRLAINALNAVQLDCPIQLSTLGDIASVRLVAWLSAALMYDGCRVDRLGSPTHSTVTPDQVICGKYALAREAWQDLKGKVLVRGPEGKGRSRHYPPGCCSGHTASARDEQSHSSARNRGCSGPAAAFCGCSVWGAVGVLLPLHATQDYRTSLKRSGSSTLFPSSSRIFPGARSASTGLPTEFVEEKPPSNCREW